MGEQGKQNESDAQIELATAIDHVRSQLELAMHMGRNSALGFQPGEVELEFNVEFTRSATAEAGVKVWVVSVGAHGDRSQTTSTHVKVSLTPVRRDGGGAILISDDSPN